MAQTPLPTTLRRSRSLHYGTGRAQMYRWFARRRPRCILTQDLRIPADDFIAAHTREGSLITPEIIDGLVQLQVGFGPVYIQRKPKSPDEYMVQCCLGVTQQSSAKIALQCAKTHVDVLNRLFKRSNWIALCCTMPQIYHGLWLS